jgi:hypothetical protein
VCSSITAITRAVYLIRCGTDSRPKIFPHPQQLMFSGV